MTAAVPPDVPGWFVGAAADGVMLQHDSQRGPVELTPAMAIGLACQLLHGAAVVEQRREMRSNSRPDRAQTGDPR